ncbi:MAG: TolC family protein, partial [Cyanobacteria bacterium]|nr:TolC family protein [Cyanobacteriota bacterium]
SAQRKMEVARRLVQLSTILIDAADKRAEKGDLPRIEVTEAEEDLQRRRAYQIDMELEFKKATYELAVFLFDSDGNPFPILEEGNVPIDWPTPSEYTNDQLQSSISQAVGRRPELKRLALQKSQADLQLKLARNNILPQADALYTQGYDTGEGGIGNVFRAQVLFSQPLYVRSARGQIKAAHFNIEALSDEERAERQRIVSEVLSAAATINAAYARFLTVRIQTQKAEQVYQGEKKRFEFGDSTVFLVTQRERQLFDARIQLIDAQRDYLQALARMQALTVNY